MSHLASLAVVTPDAFVPTVFTFPGQQPLAVRAPYAALARSAAPEDFWAFLIDGAPDPDRRLAASLAGYDFVLVTAATPVQSDADARLVLPSTFAHTRPYVILHPRPIAGRTLRDAR